MNRNVKSCILAACAVGLTSVTCEASGESSSEKPVTYCDQVVRVIQNRCQACHRPGQAAPFSLMTFEDARSWSDTIVEVVAERRMPPWFADRSVGHFANDRSLSEEEIAVLRAWVD